MCHHLLIETGYSTICTLCGVEKKNLHLDQFSHYSAPLIKGYCRVSRFRTKVGRLLGIYAGPSCSDPVWPFLDARKDFLSSPADVRIVLHASKLKAKHYDCLRLFCDAFTDFKCPARRPPYQIMKLLEYKFCAIFTGWTRLLAETNFFSYTWLLRHFLEEINSGLIVYLKPRTSRKRHQRYLDKIRLIQQSGGTLNRGSSKTRLPNVRLPIESHLCR